MTAKTRPAVVERSLTSKEAMAVLNISRETLRKLINTGELDAFKIGDGRTSDLRVPEPSIASFIERHTVTPAASR